MAATELQNKIIDAFLELLGQHGYEAVTLGKIAEASGIRLSELREAFDGKIAILSAFTRRIDAAVLDELDVSIADELPRERLMDILLSRFDALAPYRPAIAALMRAARADLSLAAQLNRLALVSMTWMLNAANIDTSGVEGAVRVQGTALIFAKVLQVWLKDDESMAKTMSALDRELRAGERTMRRLDRMSSMLQPFRRMRSRRQNGRRDAGEDEAFDQGAAI